MRKTSIVLVAALLAVGLLSACATKTGKTIREAPAMTQAGEVAVFGKVRLVENILIFMPTGEQDATLYLKQTGSKYTIKVNCEDDGSFGVYLAPGAYSVSRVDVGGYEFAPAVSLGVPKTHNPLYAGVIEFDGTPTGVTPGTEESLFVYNILDESAEFAKMADIKAPGTAKLLRKSMFVARLSLATGEYPAKVARSEDIKSKLAAKTAVVEEVVDGALATFTNPLWLVPMDFE